MSEICRLSDQRVSQSSCILQRGCPEARRQHVKPRRLWEKDYDAALFGEFCFYLVFTEYVLYKALLIYYVLYSYHYS